MDDSYSEPVPDAEVTLRKKVKKRMIIGGLMCIALPVLPVMIFLVQFIVPSEGIMFLFITLGAIGMIGLMVFIYYAQGSSMLFRSIDILRKLSPPEPIVVGKYAVLDKDPVYVLGQWGSNILFFVAFLEAERSFEEKTKIPGLIWTWEYKHRIGAVKVAKREDNYTIPIGDGTYRSGKGLLYALLLERKVIVSLYRDFTLEELSPVIEELAKEVNSHGSSSDFESSEVDWS